MKILVILSRFPYPLEKGDKLRAYHQIKSLSENNEIFLFCINNKKPDSIQINELKKYCKDIRVCKIGKFTLFWQIFKAFFQKIPLQTALFYSRKSHKDLIDFYKQKQPDRAYFQLLRTARFHKGISVPSTLDYQDAFSDGIKKRINQQAFYARFLFKLEHKRLLRLEKKIFNEFQNKVIISKQDRDSLLVDNNEDVAIIPNGVDIDYFTKKEKEKKYDLVFVGNMSYPPNIDAANFLAKEIMPLLLKQKVNAKLLLAGASPAQEVKNLSSDNITIGGWYDDIRDAYLSAKIFIAPMRIGTGLQNKLLEAMSLEIPSITSKLANGSLGATDNVNILIGNDAEDYVANILLLLNNKSLYKEISKQSRNFVSENYIWESANSKLEKIILS